MSSETITRADLTAILNEVLPTPQTSLLVETKTTSSFNVSANTVLSATQSVDVSKTGYTPLGIVGTGSNNNNLNILRANISGTTGYIRVHNPTSSALSGVTVTLYVLYLKN